MELPGFSGAAADPLRLDDAATDCVHGVWNPAASPVADAPTLSFTLKKQACPAGYRAHKGCKEDSPAKPCQKDGTAQ